MTAPERLRRTRRSLRTRRLRFLAWTFAAFLPPDADPADPAGAGGDATTDYYALLGVSRRADADAMKRAYRKRSLELHPDKLRQRGMVHRGDVITEEAARARFQAMKAAYDTLRDPRRREVYDALGHKGMDFVINPSHAWDPHILLGNLAKSSVFDRAKLMALVLIFCCAVLLQPILVCAKVDQTLREDGGALEDAYWLALLTPFWLFAALYGALLVVARAFLPLLQWSVFATGIAFLALKLDGVVSWDYALAFLPFYLWLFLQCCDACREMAEVRADMARMATVEYLEKYVLNETRQDEDGRDVEDDARPRRRYDDLTEEERDEVNQKYILVHVPPGGGGDDEGEEEDDDDLERIARSPEYQEARARHDMAVRTLRRVVMPQIPLAVLVVVQLDTGASWNWGLTFLPLWLSLFFDCCGGCYGCFCTTALAHMEVQEALAERLAKAQEEAKDQEDGAADGAEEVQEDRPEGSAGVVATETTAAAGAEDAMPAGGDGRDRPVASIDTAPSVETEKAHDKSDKDDPAIEAKPDNEGSPQIETVHNDENAKAEDEDDDDDDEFAFEMDEETFNFYQQAEQEADSKATEAQSKAIGSFCSTIFQTVLAALFVAKLNQVFEERDDEPPPDGTESFSAFWILSPVFVVSGCVVCCLACAIFGADGLDAAMSPDDASEVDDDDGGDVEVAVAAENNEPGISTSPLLPRGKGDPAEETAAAANATVSEGADDVGSSGLVPAADSPEPESAMDDLD